MKTEPEGGPHWTRLWWSHPFNNLPSRPFLQHPEMVTILSNRPAERSSDTGIALDIDAA
jgi:hypothetical protein